MVYANTKGLRLFAAVLVLLALVALLAVPAVAAAATCDAWYWAGECCCGSVRCTKELDRECTADNGTKYTEHKCSFWTTCDPT